MDIHETRIKQTRAGWLFTCPVCGYRLLLKPDRIVILDRGDRDARHTTSASGESLFAEPGRLDPFAAWAERSESLEQFNRDCLPE